MRFQRIGSDRKRGFTLLELVIVVAVVAIGVALAVPAWENIVQKRQLTSQAERIVAFINLARSEAVKRNEQVTLKVIRSNPTNWCFGAIMGATACDCNETNPSETDYCAIESIPFVLDDTDFDKASMIGLSGGTTFGFDPVRGIISGNLLFSSAPRTFTLRSDNSNYCLRLEAAVTGRVRICNPDTAKRVPGIQTCDRALATC